MQCVNSFINLLSKNYYSDFLTNVNSETVDFDSYIILVKYKGTYFYELNNSETLLKRKEIIYNIKEQYQQALNEIYAMLLSQDPSKLNSYLDLNIKAVKSHLNILKKDFYIDSNQSRYYSLVDDNPTIQDLETVYQENLKNEEIDIDEKVFEIISNTDFKKFDSFYYLGFLYQRYKTLSFLPFSLFQIGKHFILELNKIKLMNKEEIKDDNINSKNQSKMEDTYFGKFCEIIDDCNILKKSTAIGVMVDLADCIKKIKSETLLELQNKESNRNDYLDYLINEIEKQNYSKDADISYIQKWLDEYKINIVKIFDMNYRNSNIEAVVNSHYNDMVAFSPEKDKALLVQTDFYYYFCKYYADELIAYFNSKKEIKETSISTKQPLPIKPFKDEYLNIFCKEISDERVITETCFSLIYEGIIHYVPYFETEVIENLLLLGNDKRDDYLNFAVDKIKKTTFADKEKYNIDKWLKKYNVTIDEFPKFSNEELNDWLNRYYDGYYETPKDLDFILDIQIDFYCYAAMIEANKMIDFLESKRTNTNKASNINEQIEENENPNQLTVNQAVILLDKLGVFNTSIFENVSNVKKALIISQLLGKNDKNIKTSIEKLELKAKDITNGYQRDLDKIQKLLDNLE